MLHSPAHTNEMFRDTGGDVVTHGGRDAYGHFENPVDEVDPYSGGGATLIATPSFVCANGILADIGYDATEGARGVGEVVEIRERLADGSLGEMTTWRVSRITRVSDDGAEIRLHLGDEDDG